MNGGLFFVAAGGGGSVISAMPSGNAGAPGWPFGADQDTGFFFPGDDILAIATGGVEAARFSGSNFGLGQSTFGTDAAKVLAIGNGTAPTTSPADAIQMWSGDRDAGEAGLHIRSESGRLTLLGDRYGFNTIAPGLFFHAQAPASNTTDVDYKFGTKSPAATTQREITTVDISGESGTDFTTGNALVARLRFLDERVTQDSLVNLDALRVTNAATSAAIARLRIKNNNDVMGSGVAFFDFDGFGNLGIGRALSGLTNHGTYSLWMRNGTAPTSAPTNAAAIYMADAAGDGTTSLHVLTEQGHVVKLYRVGGYTQTFTTASRTMNAYTADDESGAYTGIDNAQAGTVYAQLTDLNALRTAVENLRAAVENRQQVISSIIDDLQALGVAT